LDPVYAGSTPALAANFMLDEWLYDMIRRSALEKRYSQANQIYSILWEFRQERIRRFCCGVV
jgi:hypothetical protein